eukprot:TRINITY_DN1973_c0_g3_i1.p1 TRINITY_DN1973_c0_g3~~TRINITY_DN1973_c0_g3_i1.p1  ORF type:complete len:357 (-),score=14.11 TRINITY_DN1973_c0_g3_i1:454-1524(-)
MFEPECNDDPVPFCPSNHPFGKTADISWATGTITCSETCDASEGLISHNRTIMDSIGEYVYTICFTSFRCPNTEDQTLYAENTTESITREKFAEDGPVRTKGSLTCIGVCSTDYGFIAEVASSSSPSYSCNLDHKCPRTAPYIYENIHLIMGRHEYGVVGGSRTVFEESPAESSSRILDDISMGNYLNYLYYDEFQEEYSHHKPPEVDDKIALLKDEHGNILESYESYPYATRCYKTCTKLNGIIYDSSAVKDETNKLYNYTTGFCHNSTKYCLNQTHFRRIRSDGYHSTITCIEECTRLDGYILRIDELKEIYKEDKDRFNFDSDTTVDNFFAATTAKEYKNQASDMCFYGISIK